MIFEVTNADVRKLTISARQIVLLKPSAAPEITLIRRTRIIPGRTGIIAEITIGGSVQVIAGAVPPRRRPEPSKRRPSVSLRVDTLPPSRHDVPGSKHGTVSRLRENEN